MYASNSTSSSRKRPVERASPIIKPGTTKKTKSNFAQHSPSAPLIDSNDQNKLDNLPFISMIWLLLIKTSGNFCYPPV
ncbi:hypothetical protein DPMN_007409 [Dreissena polymorpha]|uniref:Uncharacterized protein n=1 Tax=Dreissena polymorpha TaxID=45954 RepID=A0A9D4MYF3_DREPO|nr:hypothetical protein DPMN_007409 [Dreissena polymorpha]